MAALAKRTSEEDFAVRPAPRLTASWLARASAGSRLLRRSLPSLVKAWHGLPTPLDSNGFGRASQALGELGEAGGKPAVNGKKRPALGDRTNTAQAAHGWPRAKVRL